MDAARTVRALHPTARFQLLGFLDADNRSAIDERTMTNWVDENAVEYLGSASDVRPAIKDADCIVLPSYREGAPRTLIEGAAMGRPTIATDVPGCRDVVEDGTTGLLCRVRDADDLAVKMIQMIEMGRIGARRWVWPGDGKWNASTTRRLSPRLIAVRSTRWGPHSPCAVANASPRGDRSFR